MNTWRSIQGKNNNNKIFLVRWKLLLFNSIYLFDVKLRGVLPVLLNDVLFALHAVLLTMVTIIQCLVYRKPRHNPSKISMAILALFILFLLVSGIVCSVSDSLSNLDYIYFFSYVKLAITIMKYCPQVMAYCVCMKAVTTTNLRTKINFTLDSTRNVLKMLEILIFYELHKVFSSTHNHYCQKKYSCITCFPWA